MATTEKMAEAFVHETAEQVRQADEDAHLSREAFAFGLDEQFIGAKRQDILKRLEKRYGIPNTTGGSGGEDS